MPRLADPALRHPLILPGGAALPNMAHLAAVIDHPNWRVGPRTYANDFDPPDDWAARLAPYLYPGAPERLILGPYCQIANGARFITASANHVMDAVSTFPFAIFDAEAFLSYRDGFTDLPDTVVGPDCWIGDGAVLMPGARLGAGVIVGAGAVVRGTVPDYAIVAGNPGQVVRFRFSEAEIATLMELAWWDWPDAAIEAAIPALTAGDVAALAAQKPA